jgi:hypothetical protein
LRVGLRADPQNHNLYELITGIALSILDRWEVLPDDPVPIPADVNSEATLPFTLEGVTEVGRCLQAVKQAARSLNLAVSFRIAAPQAPQVLSGLS